MASLRLDRSRGLRVTVPLAGLALAAAACGGSAGGSAADQPAGPTNSAPSSAAAGPTSSAPAGNGYGAGGATTSSGAATVAVDSNSKLGDILVDGQGRALYLFKKDSGGKSSCSDACAQVWPPFTTTGDPQTSGAAKSSMLSTFDRDDGSAQAVYNGHPLYYYQGDSGPGQTMGEGLKQFGAEWYAVSPAGSEVEPKGGESGGS